MSGMDRPCVESRRLQTFFVFSKHSKWLVYDGKSLKRSGLMFSFAPPGAKRDARFALVIVAG